MEWVPGRSLRYPGRYLEISPHNSRCPILNIMVFFGDQSQINTAIAKHRPFCCVSRQHFLLVADISSAVANGNGNGSSHVIAAASRVLDGYGVKVSKDEQELLESSGIRGRNTQKFR